MCVCVCVCVCVYGIRRCYRIYMPNRGRQSLQLHKCKYFGQKQTNGRP